MTTLPVGDGFAEKRPAEACADDGRETQRSRLGATRPNIMVTGTPGTGKTELSKEIAHKLGMTHLAVGEIVERLEAYDGWDEARQCHILNEDKLLNDMDPVVSKGGFVVDYHACDLFPQRWFELVLVVRASTEVLFDRLSARNYSQSKLSENMECEIMQVLLEEARDSYPQEIVVEVQNNTKADFESILERAYIWYQNWLENHQVPPTPPGHAAGSSGNTPDTQSQEHSARFTDAAEADRACP